MSQQFSLVAVLVHAASAFRQKFSDHRLEFFGEAFQDDVKISGDPDKILLMVTNILNNAGKYSPKNSCVQITLSKVSNEIRLTISDEGKGIAPSDRKRVFKLHYRAKKTLKNTSGKGIGLYVAKKIVTAHRGTIEILPKKVKGTQVVIRLPLD